MIVFLMKSSACLAVFLLFYKLLLEKQRMHTFKRFYLLAALVLALIIPSITFTEFVEVAPTPVPAHTPVNYGPIVEKAATETAVADIETPPANYWPIVLWSIYGLGVILFCLKFLLNLWSIFRNVRNNPKLRINALINVLMNETSTPHTFFNYVFFNRKKFEHNEIPQAVFIHEATHARQKHSLDIVLVELLQIVFWFNPLVYLIKNEIKLNHEFLADQAVLDRGTDTPYYQNILLAFASSAGHKDRQPSMANAINYSSYSSIKKRFTVMKTQTSKKSILFRSLLLMPLLVILLYGFTETKMVTMEKEAAVEGSFNRNENSTNYEIGQNSGTENLSDRSVELAGLILDSETLEPLEKVEIYDSKGSIISVTDQRGYYKVRFDDLGEGEIKFKFSLHKDGYKTLAQREHWGNLQGKIAFTNYYGLQKKESNALEFSQHIPNNRNLSYSSVLTNFHLVKTRFEFNKKMEKAKKGNQHILLEIDNAYYLANNSSWIKIGSKDDLISIDDNRVVQASEVNGLIKRKEITGMTPLDGINSAQYAIYTIPVDHAVRPLENQAYPEQIIIKINRKGQLLFKERSINIGNLKKALQEINTELSYEERKVGVRAFIVADLDAPKKELAEIEQILESYGVAQINIVGPENAPFYPPVQQGATQKQLSKYNRLAKKYNAQPKAKRVIPAEDLKSLETIYRKMSKEQKADALPFPECPDSKSNQQEGANQKQMGEYNALAKKYNTMLADSKSIRIKKSDVDRLVHLHGIMTKEQRASAEPFPDFPEPPEPPVPPSAPNLSEKEMADEVIEYIIANQDPHDRPGGIYLNRSTIGKPQKSISEYPKVTTYFDLHDEDVTIYRDGKEISHPEMEQMQKAGEISTVNVSKNANGQRIIHIVTKNERTTKTSLQNLRSSPAVLDSTKPEENKNTSGWSISSGANRDTRNVQESAPIPPVAPTIAMHVERDKYSKELKSSINDYLEANKSYEKAVSEYRIKGNGNTQNLWNLYNLAMEKYVTYHVLAKEEGNFVQPSLGFKERKEVKKSSPPAPPAPPKPKAPLDYVIEMAKKEARFYYEGKEIGSDKAIELMKKNKNLNIDSRREKGKRPVVKLFKEPIVIDR